MNGEGDVEKTAFRKISTQLSDLCWLSAPKHLLQIQVAKTQPEKSNGSRILPDGSEEINKNKSP